MELRAMAFKVSSRGTRSRMADAYVGALREMMMPARNAMTMISWNLMTRNCVGMAGESARTIMPVWVQSSMVRREERSAMTTPNSESTRAGMWCAEQTMPNQSVELDDGRA